MIICICGSLGNLRGCLDCVVFVEGDVHDRDLVLSVMRRYGVRAVMHLAAIVGVNEVYRDPVLGFEVNIGGTFNALETSRILNVDVFVYASSAAVYDDPIELPLCEDHVARPRSVYGATKLAGEVLVRGYAENYGLTTAVLRYFNIYGPRMRPGPYAGVIYKLIERALRNEPLIIYGDGEQTRDFVYVEDVAEANLKARKLGVYNIEAGNPITINELGKKFLELKDKNEKTYLISKIINKIYSGEERVFKLYEANTI